MYTCPLFRGFYFSISCRCSCFQSRVIISVPFPGILFLNEKWIYSKCLELKCFRPLPGDLISQYAFEDQVKDLICFRPLPGDLISQLQILAPSPMQLASFRPLPGDLISQSFTCLILTGFQSRIAAQNQIRLWNKLLSP